MKTFLTTKQATQARKPENKDLYIENSVGCRLFTSPCLGNTRKEHGLFSIQQKRDGIYHILLSSIEEMLIHCGCEYNLGMEPRSDFQECGGKGYIRDTIRTPFPAVWYCMGPVTLRKEIILSPREPKLLINYVLEEGLDESELFIRPLLGFRPVHTVRQYKGHTAFITELEEPNKPKISLQGSTYPPLWISISEEAKFLATPEWRLQQKLNNENPKDNNSKDDIFSPGIFKCRLGPGKSVLLSLSSHHSLNSSPQEFRQTIEELLLSALPD